MKVDIAHVKQFSVGNFTSLWLTANNSVLFCGDNPRDNSIEAYVPTSTNHSISNILFVSAQRTGALFMADDVYILGTSPNYELGVKSYINNNFTRLNLQLDKMNNIAASGVSFVIYFGADTLAPSKFVAGNN